MTSLERVLELSEKTDILQNRIQEKSQYILRKAQEKARLREELQERNTLDYKAANEYALFYAWCRAFNHKETVASFNQYIKQQHRELDFWIKKKIAEKYFDYEYSYDHKTNEWKARRKRKCL